MIVEVAQRDNKKYYSISWALIVWPGHALEFGWRDLRTRDNPVGRRLAQWFESRAA